MKAPTLEQCYRLLACSTSSTKEQIKASFRRLAHIHHPDKEGGSVARFTELKNAYDYLIKNHVQKEVDTKTYPYFKNGMVFYWPGDPGSYVGDEE